MPTARVFLSSAKTRPEVSHGAIPLSGVRPQIECGVEAEPIEIVGIVVAGAESPAVPWKMRSRVHRIELLAQAIQRQLLQHVGRPIYPFGDFV
jgi:hypothetical protein